MNIPEDIQRAIEADLEQSIRTVFMAGGIQDFSAPERFSVGMAYRTFKSSENLERLTESLVASSGNLVWLTRVLTGLTLILAVLTIALLMNS
jgi:hypothetical protein